MLCYFQILDSLGATKSESNTRNLRPLYCNALSAAFVRGFECLTISNQLAASVVTMHSTLSVQSGEDDWPALALASPPGRYRIRDVIEIRR